jgi:hypothetical protein
MPGEHPDAQTSYRTIPSRHAMTAGQRLMRWAAAWSAGPRGKWFRSMLWSAEEHKSGAVHCHALLVTTRAVSPTHCDRCRARVSGLHADWRKLKESWFIHNGLARVYPYNPAFAFGAERYVLKYVLKPTCLDWGFEQW